MSYYLPGPSDLPTPALPPGGLLNQYLRKSSDLDYDADWANVAAGGSSGNLVDLGDVDAIQRVDGSVLVYNGSTTKFEANDLNTKLTLTDGGNF